jgi:hypothetical protein
MVFHSASFFISYSKHYRRTWIPRYRSVIIFIVFGVLCSCLIHKKMAMFLQLLFYERKTWFSEKDRWKSFSFVNFYLNRNFFTLFPLLLVMSQHLTDS